MKFLENYGMRLTATIVGILLLGTVGCNTNDDRSGSAAVVGPYYTGVLVRDVAVSPSLLETGQRAMVEVFVTDSFGVALPDEVVLLSVSPSGAGVFADGIFKTDADGVATTTFTAVTSGTATVKATAQSDENSSASETIRIEDHVVISANGRMVLAVTPTLMPADGQSTATIDVTLTDLTGNPADDMTYVKLAAGEKFVDMDGDGVWTPNVDAVVYDVDDDGKWDPSGQVDPVVYIDNGHATATFTAGNKPGIVYIKVTAGELGHQITDDIEVSLTPIEPIKTIALTPEWQRIQVRGTGGIEWTHILAEAFDAHGNPAPENLPMEFTITSGPGGGEDLDGDPVGPITVMTNALGQATVTLNAGTISGTVFLRAHSGTVISEATQVTIRSGPPAFISLGAEDCNVPSWEFVNVQNRITAVVVDQWGNEVPDSTAVYFGTEQGLIEGAAETEIVPTIRGKATTYWNSGQPKNDGYVFYWCETSGGTVTDTSFFFESGPAASGTVLQHPDTLWADGHSHGDVVIEVLDINGVFMDTGSPIEMDADLGTIPSGTIEDGCHTSIYIGRYTAPVLDLDYEYTIPDSGIGAIANIHARAGGYYGYNEDIKVVLKTGAAYYENCSINTEPTINYGTTVPVNVSIRDRWGNPLGGHLIEVLDDGIGGTIAGEPRHTDVYGRASGFTFTATTDTTVTASFITANDLDPNYGGISLLLKVNLEK